MITLHLLRRKLEHVSHKGIGLVTQVMKKVLLNQSGSGLVSLMIGIAILAIIIAVAAKFISRTVHATKHYERRVNISEMTNYLRKKISCDNTLASINVDTQCNASSPTYFRLIDYRGNYLTDNLVTSGNFRNSGKFIKGRKWYLKASCDATEKTLRVELARQANNGSSFSRSKHNKKPLDFNSAINPIIGKDIKLCYGHFLGDPLVDKVTQRLRYVSSECEDLRHQDDGGKYVGSVRCPPGKILVTGGVSCPYAGYMTNSYPDFSDQSWHGSCCGDEGAGRPTTFGEIFILCR